MCERLASYHDDEIAAALVLHFTDIRIGNSVYPRLIPAVEYTHRNPFKVHAEPVAIVNAADIKDAKEARELGLDVEVPEPQLAIDTEPFASIDEAKEALRVVYDLAWQRVYFDANDQEFHISLPYNGEDWPDPSLAERLRVNGTTIYAIAEADNPVGVIQLSVSVCSDLAGYCNLFAELGDDPYSRMLKRAIAHFHCEVAALDVIRRAYDEIEKAIAEAYDAQAKARKQARVEYLRKKFGVDVKG